MVYLVYMNEPVVTNLRISRDDWLQLKTIAAELGMSVNEYVNYLIRDLSAKREFLPDMKPNQVASRKNAPIWALGDIAKRTKSIPMGKLSSDDMAIYE